jgi:hypothetical protein
MNSPTPILTAAAFEARCIVACNRAIRVECWLRRRTLDAMSSLAAAVGIKLVQLSENGNCVKVKLEPV